MIARKDKNLGGWENFANFATMSNSVRPKKALGQHFLTDMGVASRIAATLDSYASLPVLEIGPGTGVLTQFLMESHPADKLSLIEIDTESVEWLKKHLPEPQPSIIEGDFLTMPFEKMLPGNSPCCIIGNYPYNISSQIFFKVLDHRDRVVCCSGMLQREVAERIAAAPGTKARGILSVLLQAWYDIEYLFTVSEHVFNPPPKVKSGVIRMTRNAVTDLGCDADLFRTVVKTTFGQRRKTIRNSIRGLLPPGEHAVDDKLGAMRPEQLTVGQFVELTRAVQSARGL